MESLQFAQVLADLSDLQNTDPAAARALLTSTTRPPPPPPPPTRRTTSSNSPTTHIGRKFTPPLSRTTSSRGTTPLTTSFGGESKSTTSSGAGTPNANSERGNPLDADEDLKRARTLLELFEMRGKFKQMGDLGLLRSKERVDAVAARYAKKDLEEKEKEKIIKSKYFYPSSKV